MKIETIETFQKLIKKITVNLRGTEFQEFCLNELEISYSSYINKMNGTRKWKMEEVLAICEQYDIEIIAIKKL